jgi:myosin heavy subunit
MPIRKDPLESGKQRLHEGLTELLELTEPLDAYREYLRLQIRNLDRNKDVTKHRVASAFSRIEKLVKAKEQEMMRHLDELCDEAKSKAGEKLRETAKASNCASKAAQAASELLEVSDKQSFLSLFTATSQMLQHCLDDLLLFSADIPKEDSDTGRLPQLLVIETQATELCQQVTDILSSCVTVDKTIADSGPVKPKEHREEKSEQSSSWAFTFQSVKSTINENTKSLKHLPLSSLTIPPLISTDNVEEAKPPKQLTSTGVSLSSVPSPNSALSITCSVKGESQTSGRRMYSPPSISSSNNALVTKTAWSDNSSQVLSETRTLRSSWPVSPESTSVYSHGHLEAFRSQMPHHSGQLTLSWLQVLQGWQMQAVITEAISPSHFWVQVGGSPLQQLMERLK